MNVTYIYILINIQIYRSTSTTADSTTTDTTTASNSGIIYPIRQPRGPEPGKNFASRKLVDERDQLSKLLARQQLTHVGA